MTLPVLISLATSSFRSRLLMSLLLVTTSVYEPNREKTGLAQQGMDLR